MSQHGEKFERSKAELEAENAALRAQLKAKEDELKLRDT